MRTVEPCTVDPAYKSMKQKATRRVFEDLVFMALETGNQDLARSRLAEAQEELDGTTLNDLVEEGAIT